MGQEGKAIPTNTSSRASVSIFRVTERQVAECRPGDSPYEISNDNSPAPGVSSGVPHWCDPPAAVPARFHLAAREDPQSTGFLAAGVPHRRLLPLAADS